MAEFRYVRLPTDGKQARSEQVDDYANAELATRWVAAGWEPIAIDRSASIGKIGFLLRKG